MTKLKAYYRNLDSYKTEHDCNVAVCELVDAKFPGLLNDLKRPGIQSFDGIFTAREAFDHLDEEVGYTTAANEKFATHLQAVIDRKYKPVQNDTKNYFGRCEHDLHKANSTKVCTVTLELLLVYAQRAFREAGNKHKVQDIENSWTLVESANVDAFTDVKVRYKQFKEHYTMHLQNLVLNVEPNKPQPQAHVVASHGDMIAHMQGTMQSVVEDQNQLRDQYAHIVEANYTAQGHNGPPSVVVTASTSTGTGTSNNSANTAAPTMSYNDVQEMIKKALQGVVTTPGIPTGTMENQRKGKGKWRQWRSWCYTCGVNLNHSTSGCRKFLKAPGHDTHTEATKDDPQGGNTTKNHLWMKWCHSITNKAQDSKGE